MQKELENYKKEEPKQETDSQAKNVEKQITYNIAFAINRPFLLFCMVTLYSLLKNNQKHNFNIYILHNSCLKEEEINKITKQNPLSQFRNFKIHLVDVSPVRELKQLQTIDNWTKEVYFKVFLPELLPQINKIMILDVDVIVQGDIAQLLETEMEDNLFLGEKDIQGHDKYICAGVLLLNLEQMRKEKITQELLKVMQEEGIHEQDALNELYYDRILVAKQNDIYMITKELKGLQSANIIHYTMPKPWNLNQARSIKKSKRKYLIGYYGYLKEFIDKKYKIRFILLTLYAFAVIPIASSYSNKIKKIIAKKLKKEKYKLRFKESFLSRKIIQYSFIKRV